MKKIISIVLLLALLLMSSACGLFTEPKDAAPKEFNADGLTITLTEGFTQSELNGMTCFDSSKAAVFIVKEAFTLLEGLEDYTIDEYAELVMASNESKNPALSKKDDGTPVMEFDFYNEEEKATYDYYCVMLKSSEAFYLVQFACLKENYEVYKPYFEAWSASIKY